MSFNQNKKYQTKIASQAAGDEDIYSLNKHVLGPGALAESEWVESWIGKSEHDKYSGVPITKGA